MAGVYITFTNSIDCLHLTNTCELWQKVLKTMQGLSNTFADIVNNKQPVE